ncbi:MAG TPA: pyridoxal-phosphate dependent enzyme, partial [Mycobacteriales bacterium]|nr:pyridoxal-phosphate dependent enzyme [Mycobacteriales bacterium]
VSGIDDPLRGYAHDGTITLREVYRSDGRAIGLTDTAIRAAQADLAADGIFVEPAAAASVAALPELARRGDYRADDVIVCVLTGHGIKTNATAPTAPPVTTVDEAAERLARAGMPLH